MDQNNTPHPNVPNDTAVMTVKDWIITFLILAIPIVGLVMIFVWAFGDGNKNRKHFMQAYLWLMLVCFIIMIPLVFFVMTRFPAAVMQQQNFGQPTYEAPMNNMPSEKFDTNSLPEQEPSADDMSEQENEAASEVSEEVPENAEAAQ
ncbi:hypothetical protein NEISICOT_01074 [Neisseria sicca ATCC 29256]|uniref:Uncharacterized protein n=1 Tax=Neisseria sicca ATCC 29256 TaxID=547045 RepID=C6M3U3_NEISI|nr:hypothetical protein [Neisseria sicca]EET45079.1 hypothetical protein NEISICOT_01074 [Neisseria sicca ATCC 29256]QMT37949.1 hypothetical protein H3L95_12835 [Neisseria sicca]